MSEKRHLEESLQHLSVVDLMRIRKRFYATDSTVKRKDHLAKTIAAKVHQRARPSTASGYSTIKKNSAGAIVVQTTPAPANKSPSRSFQKNVYNSQKPQASQAADKATRELTILPASTTSRPLTRSDGQPLSSSMAAALTANKNSASNNNGHNQTQGSGNGSTTTYNTTTASKEGKEVPMYMRAVGISRSEWFLQCVADLGITVDAPMDTIQTRRNFLKDPASHLSDWVRLCSTSARRLANVYHCKLDRACSGDGMHSSSGHYGGGGNRSRSGKRKQALSDKRLEIQKRDLAEWKIRRFVEQGPGYLYHVWPKLVKHELDLEYNGNYCISNGALAQTFLNSRVAHKKRVEKLSVLTELESHSRSKADKSVLEQSQSNQNESNQDVDDDVGDEQNFPSATVLVTPNNTLEFKVYLSESQTVELSSNRKEEEPISMSSFLFRAEAACINVDKKNGIDYWIGIQGPWMNQLIYFARDEEGRIDSFSTDKMVFEKRYISRGGNSNDPFKCSKCGNVRMVNNNVYVLPKSEDFRRGKYYCVICKSKTVHIQTDSRFKKPTPPWKSSIGKMPLDTTTLSEPPFKGLRPSFYM